MNWLQALTRSLLVAVLTWTAPSFVRGADFLVTYTDPPNDGFFDPNLGSARRAAFQAAVQFWADSLPQGAAGAFPIQIQADFESLGGCAALGQTMFITFIEGAAGAELPLPNVFYPTSLAKTLLGDDYPGFGSDMTIRFNRNIDLTFFCTGQNGFYYGTDPSSLPADQFFFYQIALHEIGHGLGITARIDVTGAWSLGKPDVYSILMEDHSLGATLDSVTQSQRLAAITDTGDLHWIGRFAVERGQSLGATGIGQDSHLPIWAPSQFVAGQSLLHLSDSISVDGMRELMAPFRSRGSVDSNELTVPILRDIGWGCAGDCSGDFSVAVNELVTAVNISLNRAPLSNCTAADGDFSGVVRINDLVLAVRNNLESCSGAPEVSVGTSGTGQVIVGSAQGIAGQIVTVPISVQGLNGGAAAVQVDVWYNDANIDLISCSLAGVGSQHAVSHELINTISGVSISRVAVHPDELSTAVLSFADGVVATCDFQIASGADPGNYVLVAEEESVCDVDGVNFGTTCANGLIQVCPGCGCE